MTTKPTITTTGINSIADACVKLDLDESTVKYMCRNRRLGYTFQKIGRAWVITDEEIASLKAAGPRPPGRPATSGSE